MEHKILKCGCVDYAIKHLKDGTDVPCCITHNCTEFMEEQPDLSSRKARCVYCGKERESDKDRLPFFEYVPGREYDRYYCGCKGWD